MVLVQVMEKDPRKVAMPVKGSASNAVTRGVVNRIQSRRDRRLALQQDVFEFLCLNLSDSVASCSSF